MIDGGVPALCIAKRLEAWCSAAPTVVVIVVVRRVLQEHTSIIDHRCRAGHQGCQLVKGGAQLLLCAAGVVVNTLHLVEVHTGDFFLCLLDGSTQANGQFVALHIGLVGFVVGRRNENPASVPNIRRVTGIYLVDVQVQAVVVLSRHHANVVFGEFLPYCLWCELIDIVALGNKYESTIVAGIVAFSSTVNPEVPGIVHEHDTVLALHTSGLDVVPNEIGLAVPCQILVLEALQPNLVAMQGFNAGACAPVVGSTQETRCIHIEEVHLRTFAHRLSFWNRLRPLRIGGKAYEHCHQKK